jgi:hypothetical protein
VTAPDLIASGREPGRVRPLPSLLLVLALVLGVAGHLLDAAVRGQEADRLLAQAQAGQEQITYSDRRVAATVAYTSPLLLGAAVPVRVRDGLQRLVSEAADGQLAAVRRERGRAAAAPVLPWHRDGVAARTALVRYLDGELSYLGSLATGSDALFVAHPELAQLRAGARDATVRAVGPGGRARVEAAFGVRR